MTLLKKGFLVLALTFGISLGGGGIAHGVDLGWGNLNESANEAGLSGSDSLTDMVALVINSVLSISGALLFIYFIYAGFLWMTAAGDTKNVDKAKTIMRNAVVGLVVLMASYALALFVAKSLGIKTTRMTEVASGSGLSTNGELVPFVGDLIAKLVSFAGVIVFIIFIYAGFLWMTAAGDTKNVDKAKTIMRNAVVGLVVLLLAYALTDFVVTLLSQAEVT